MALLLSGRGQTGLFWLDVIMSTWGRRTLVVLGIVILIFGGLIPGPFTIAAIITAGILFVIAGRRSSSDANDSSDDLIVVEGVNWTKGADGRAHHWDAESQTWILSDPPPPHVIRAFAARQTSTKRGSAIPAVTLAVVALLGLGLWALFDPYANIPGISKMVCSMKGASWHDDPGFGTPPGCYSREPEDPFDF